MTPDLRRELRQSKPFKSLHEEASLNISRTAAVINDGLDAVLHPRGLSKTQYNVLRMLRGAGQTGLCRNEIRDRLITRMPDVTRLLDRMEESGLVDRERSDSDRRLVNTQITPRGQELIDALDDEIGAEHRRRLGHLTRDQLRMLVELLSVVREAMPDS